MEFFCIKDLSKILLLDYKSEQNICLDLGTFPISGTITYVNDIAFNLIRSMLINSVKRLAFVWMVLLNAFIKLE